MADLLRLQIPRGWAVMDNNLYDTDPTLSNGSDTFIENWFEGFIEDVLWIQECQVTNDGKHEIPQSNFFTIDIGWYPDSNINGSYVAKLAWCSADELKTVEAFESKDRFEIREKIEFWMGDIADNYIARRVNV